MHQTQRLYEQNWVLYDTTTSADLLIGNVSLAHLTLILNLDELALSDKAKDLDDMADDLISWYRLNQLDLIVRLEISHLVLDLPNDLEVVDREHQLDIDVDLV